MKNNFKYIIGILALLIMVSSCKKNNYTLGDLTAPSNVVITTVIAGQDATHPNGDGSGDVQITLTGKNVLSYKIDYNAADGISLVFLPNGKATTKYTTLGLNTYRITVVVYGAGGTATTITKDIQVQSNFTPDPTIVANLTGGTSKIWGVNKDIAGHFGVGPWDPGCYTGCWWSAAINEKVSCCNCFYTARFTFTKLGTNSYSLTVATPDGAFTKTGQVGGLPGIPATGAEGCYAYGGGTSSFSFGPATSGLITSPTNPSTRTSINLAGVNTFIGYGASLKEYEILSITATELRLRMQGTETGNSWNLIMKAY